MHEVIEQRRCYRIGLDSVCVVWLQSIVNTSSSPSLLKSPNPSSEASTSATAWLLFLGAEGAGMPSAPSAFGWRDQIGEVRRGEGRGKEGRGEERRWMESKEKAVQRWKTDAKKRRKDSAQAVLPGAHCLLCQSKGIIYLFHWFTRTSYNMQALLTFECTNVCNTLFPLICNSNTLPSTEPEDSTW